MTKMSYNIDDVPAIGQALKRQQAKLPEPKEILKDRRLKQLLADIKQQSADQRAAYGQVVNRLKAELQAAAAAAIDEEAGLSPIDITAPFDSNVPAQLKPSVGRATDGSLHPIWQEIDGMLDIYYRMGFNAELSRQLDDDYHMFESLNFPSDHPARDDYDTFMTPEGLIAPAHTSTMQNRVLKQYRANLAKGQAIAVVIPGRVFRNEDVDATHEHTFYQLEGVYVDQGINVGHLIATLQTFMSEYFHQPLKSKIQPFYFPFTEPSLEFAIERPAMLKKDDSEAESWLELLGCGLIHPNVLKAAAIDPVKYSGFAWGGGVERLIMLKYGIEDLRHFHSGKLDFLRQF